VGNSGACIRREGEHRNEPFNTLPAEKAKEQAASGKEPKADHNRAFLRLFWRGESMPQAVKSSEDIAMVREFFASLSRSERLRMYDFFKSRIGSTRTMGSGSTLEPEGDENTRHGYQSNRQESRSKV